MKFLRFCLILFASALFSHADDFRVWVSDSGSNIVARFTSCNKSTLSLVGKDGTIREIPFDNLCSNDLFFVCKYIGDGRARPIQKDTYRIWCSTTLNVILAKFIELKKGIVYLEGIQGNKVQIRYESLTNPDLLALKEYLGDVEVANFTLLDTQKDVPPERTTRLSEYDRKTNMEWLMRNRPKDAMRIRQAQANAKGQQVMVLENTPISTSNPNQLKDMYKRGWIKEGDVVIGDNIIHSYGGVIEDDSNGYIVKDKNGDITDRYDKKGNRTGNGGFMGEGMGSRVPDVITVE
jgi:hypothetical protein